MLFISMDLNKCVACRNCEYVCALTNAGDFYREHSNIRVNYYHDVNVCMPLTCLQCEDAWCQEVCPAAAITKNPATGGIEIDKDRCVGCKMCMLACPLGNIHYDTKRQRSQKCNLCGGDPKCVKFCISGALKLVDSSDYARSNRAMFHRFMSEFSGCGPSCGELEP